MAGHFNWNYRREQEFARVRIRSALPNVALSQNKQFIVNIYNPGYCEAKWFGITKKHSNLEWFGEVNCLS